MGNRYVFRCLVLDYETILSSVSVRMFTATWSTEGMDMIRDKGYTTTTEAENLPADILVFDTIAETYGLVYQLLPIWSLKAQAGEENVLYGKFFSMHFLL